MKTIILVNLLTVAMAGMVPVQKRQSLLGNVVGTLGSLFPGEKHIVELDYANYRGVTNPQYNTQDFLGMKFARANRLGEFYFHCTIYTVANLSFFFTCIKRNLNSFLLLKRLMKSLMQTDMVTHVHKFKLLEIQSILVLLA